MCSCWAAAARWSIGSADYVDACMPSFAACCTGPAALLHRMMMMMRYACCSACLMCALPLPDVAGRGQDISKGRRRDQGAVKISCARQVGEGASRCRPQQQQPQQHLL